MGRRQFYQLLLWLEGEDLRSRPLIERKRILESVIRGHPSILYARHIEHRGVDLFRLVCPEQDLEGVVAKNRLAAHGCEQTPWTKILNPAYSQREGRRELFEKKRAAVGTE